MRTSARALAVVDLAAAGGTDAGRQREQNEDRFHLDPAAGVFLVVDGVGGEAAGEVAAQLAVQTIVNRLARQDSPADVRVREAITLANQDIYRQARLRPDRAGMACVLTLAVLEGRQLTIGHVGDSRLYKITPRGIAKLTHDHSPVGEREDAREISETQAMQHARRNEVYRDVGSEPRHPDDPHFIETVLTEFEDDAAILLCSDGLSDMVTAAEIDRLVRTHAGDPQRVVDELIAAANDAGGRDNVTVVFAEGPLFARRGAGGATVLRPWPAEPVSTTPLAELAEPALPPPPRPGLLRRIIQSRVLALLLGILVGVGGMLGVLVYMPAPLGDAATPRRLVVGSSEPGAYPSITEALAASRAGDAIWVEPGEYAETLLVPEGVRLEARVPGRSVLVAPEGAANWIAITAAGSGSIRGFRLEGRTAAPLMAGVRVLGGDVEVDDMTFEGTMLTGVEVAGRGAGAIIRSSRFTISGLPLRIGEGAAPSVRHNLFVSAANGRGHAVELAAGAAPRLDGNVFVHFAQAVAPPARRDLLDGNFVIQAGPRR